MKREAGFVSREAEARRMPGLVSCETYITLTLVLSPHRERKLGLFGDDFTEGMRPAYAGFHISHFVKREGAYAGIA